MRTATPACGDDLNIVLNTVQPDVGTLPSGAAAPTDLEQAGPRSVSTTSLSVPIAAEVLRAVGLEISVSAGTAEATVYLPDGDGPFPLVVVLAGFQASHTMYAPYSNHFASYGMAVLGIDTRSDASAASHDKEALEVVQAISWMLSGESGFAAKIDATKIAVAGHSKGGKVSFFAAALDPRIDLVIAWDPVNSGGPPCFLCSDPNPATCPCNALPVAPNCQAMQSGVEQYMQAESLVIGAPPDALFNPDENSNCKYFYRGAPSPSAFVLLEVSHADWILSADVIRISKTVSAARLLARFSGLTGLERWLPGGSYLPMQPQLTAVQTK